MAGWEIRCYLKQLNSMDRSAHPLIELKGGYMVFDSGGELPKPKRSAGKRFVSAALTMLAN